MFCYIILSVLLPGVSQIDFVSYCIPLYLHCSIAYSLPLIGNISIAPQRPNFCILLPYLLMGTAFSSFLVICTFNNSIIFYCITPIPFVVNLIQFTIVSILIRTDMLKYEVALELTKYFNKEQNYAPWYSLMGSLGYISSMLEGRPGYPLYEVSRLLFILTFNAPLALL